MFQEGRRIDKMTARSKRRGRGVGGWGRCREITEDGSSHHVYTAEQLSPFFFVEWTQMQEPFCALLLGESLPFHYDFRITVDLGI